MIIYCTNDPTKWGFGVGRLLHDFEVDDNFWFIESQIAALTEHLSGSVVSLAYFTLTPPNQLFAHFTDGSVNGPFIIPSATWHLTNPPTGAWLPLNVYVPFDVFNFNGTCYLVVIGHTSGATFDPNQTDGMGHNVLAPIITVPSDVLPTGGNPSDVLTVITGGGSSVPTVQWLPPPGLATIRTRTTPTFTPALIDANTYNRFTSLSGCTVFVPPNSSVAFPIATEIHCRQANGEPTANVMFEGLTDVVVIHPVHGFLNQTLTDGATVTLKKVDTDAWDIFGLLARHS